MKTEYYLICSYIVFDDKAKTHVTRVTDENLKPLCKIKLTNPNRWGIETITGEECSEELKVVAEDILDKPYICLHCKRKLRKIVYESDMTKHGCNRKGKQALCDSCVNDGFCTTTPVRYYRCKDYITI